MATRLDWIELSWKLFIGNSSGYRGCCENSNGAIFYDDKLVHKEMLIKSVRYNPYTPEMHSNWKETKSDTGIYNDIFQSEYQELYQYVPNSFWHWDHNW